MSWRNKQHKPKHRHHGLWNQKQQPKSYHNSNFCGCNVPDCRIQDNCANSNQEEDWCPSKPNQPKPIWCLWRVEWCRWAGTIRHYRLLCSSYLGGNSAEGRRENHQLLLQGEQATGIVDVHGISWGRGGWWTYSRLLLSLWERKITSDWGWERKGPKWEWGGGHGEEAIIYMGKSDAWLSTSFFARSEILWHT